MIRTITAGDMEALAAFFETLAQDPETVRYFHPHPLTRALAQDICSRAASRRDRYTIAEIDSRIVAYSLLRGWDEGYSIPSFGVCVTPELRNTGLGRRLLQHAIAESCAAGAKKLRLTVHKDNLRAAHVYRKFGFELTDKNAQEFVGLLELA